MEQREEEIAEGSAGKTPPGPADEPPRGTDGGLAEKTQEERTPPRPHSWPVAIWPEPYPPITVPSKDRTPSFSDSVRGRDFGPEEPALAGGHGVGE